MRSKSVRSLLPAISLLIAATLWGVLWYPLRLLESANLPGVWVTLVGYTAALLVVLPATVRRWGAWRRHPGLMTALALASGWCNISFIVAVTEGIVVRVVLLFYLSPVWAVLLSRAFLGERLSFSSAIVLVLAVTGALIMLWDPIVGWPWPRSDADWLALSAGFAFALANVLVRALQGVVLPMKVVSNMSGGMLVAAIWIGLESASFPNAAESAWFGAAALGVFGLVIMTVSVQYGVTHMPIHRSAVILLFELVVAAISAWWLAGEVPIARDWVGGALIIAASLVSARAQALRPRAAS